MLCARPSRGFSLIEMVLALAVGAAVGLAAVTVGLYWRGEAQQRLLGASVPLIAQAMRQYARAHGSLPDLAVAEDTDRWLALYTPPGSATLADGTRRTLPEGIAYERLQTYVPSSIPFGQTAGRVRLTGTGCEPTDRSTECTLNITP
ncbi:prepilin-type N-terminal cleavage/methylation domain-containing protein [Gloeobacter morelensis]|uniref:Prepilin-type N-terminal cleavage/methylation domain-containing protein n=1 Tax=Gloeobacter morelensis MG652769 TaxID=2781736 RepID=A0ABY3PPK9_9CYAN|nr:prepilin-type N-terminal cleavage/methylation domain-containing protein [Gloeobacter morelensis]UFP95642.1 prepilin-type N-terminal cleavage/methylation domain-containing protein [Gloeobacter morelensis MG652769]